MSQPHVIAPERPPQACAPDAPAAPDPAAPPGEGFAPVLEAAAAGAGPPGKPAMVNFTKLQILQSAGTSMLAQANSAPQSVLKLLG